MVSIEREMWEIFKYIVGGVDSTVIPLRLLLVFGRAGQQLFSDTQQTLYCRLKYFAYWKSMFLFFYQKL